MRYILMLILYLMGSIFAYAQERPSLHLPEDKIVVIVNNTIITQSEVDELLAMFYTQAASQYSEERLAKEMENMQKAALDRLIEDKLILEEAKRQKIEVLEEAIEKRLAEIKARFGNDAEFEEALIQQGTTLSDLKTRVEEQLMMSVMVEIYVKKNITVSPVEITAYYQAHKHEFKQPESANVDSIFCNSRNKIDEAFSALRKGQDFKDVEKRLSSASSLGIVKRGELRKEIEEAIFNLEEGQFSGIVETENGFYIFKLINKRPERIPPLSSLEAKIRDYLKTEKYNKCFKEWIAELKQNAYIVIK